MAQLKVKYSFPSEGVIKATLKNGRKNVDIYEYDASSYYAKDCCIECVNAFLDALREQEIEFNSDSDEWHEIVKDISENFEKFEVDFDSNTSENAEENEEEEEVSNEATSVAYSSNATFSEAPITAVSQSFADKHYAYSTYKIDKCFENLMKGANTLIPGIDSIPKSLSFIDESGCEYYARIERITVVPKDAMNPFEGCSVDLVAVAFSVKECDSIIMFSLGRINESNNTSYRDTTYYEGVDEGRTIYRVPTYYTNYNSLVLLYDLNTCPVVVNSDSNLIAQISPALTYYHRLLRELNTRKSNEKIRVNLDLFREYYDAFNNLLVDESRIILPVYGDTLRIRSISILAYQDDADLPDRYDFFEASAEPVSNDVMKTYRKLLEKDDVLLPDDCSLCIIDMIELGEKNTHLLTKVVTDGSIAECEIINNVEGEKVRLKRIISGIASALCGDVINPKLVNLVCGCGLNSDAIDALYGQENYVVNEKFTNYLKQEYSVLKSNEEQLIAIDKAVQMDDKDVDIMLIQGPPGTGKTELILSLAKELMKRGKKTLITSNVHVACDNVVDRFKNNKDIALKRYTAIKGEQYQKEFRENQRKYIQNQVLAGFDYNEKSISSKEVYDNIIGKKENLLAKRELMLASKADYDKELENYNKLLGEKGHIQNSIENAQTLVQSCAEKQESLSYSIEEGKKNKNLIENDIDAIRVSNDSKEAEYNELVSSSKEVQSVINKLYAAVSELESSISDYDAFILDKQKDIDSLSKKCEERKQYASFLSFLTFNDIGKKAKAKFFDDIEYPDEYYKELLGDKVDCLKTLAHLYKMLQDDIVFWKDGGAISHSVIEYLYYTEEKCPNELNTFIGDDVALSLGDIYKYYRSPSLLKSLGIFKIEGKSKSYYENLIKTLEKELKQIQYHSDDYIFKGIKSSLPDDAIVNELDKVQNNIATKEGEINNIAAEIGRRGNSISNWQTEILAKKEAISSNTRQLLSLQNKIKAIEKELQQNKEALTAKGEELQLLTDKIHLEENEIQKTIEKINELGAEIKENENTLKETEQELFAVYKEKETQIKGYDAFVSKLNIDVNRIDNDLSALEGAIERIDSRAKLLMDNGWSEEDAYSILFNYIDELTTITKKDDTQIENYFDGRGTAFDDLVDIRNNGAGALISMTTSQVASLLNNTRSQDLTFDYAIIDEASKCRFEDVIISLPRVKHLILIGDFMQLDPMYKRYAEIDMTYQKLFSIEQWDALNRSTFSVLLSEVLRQNEKRGIKNFTGLPFAAVMKRQYRMNKGIFDIIAPVYAIHSGFELIDEKKMASNDVMCMNISGNELPAGTSQYNIEEAETIVALLREIQKSRSKYPSIKTIGVITGYRAQENHIRRGLQKGEKISGLQIGTFDRFQGREYDLVIVSLVRTKRLGFTNNVRRMNVAFSRAKNHLLVLGNMDALYKVASTYGMGNEENSNDDGRENEFVVRSLIPKLYGIKENFISLSERVNAALKFIEENEYE